MSDLRLQGTIEGTVLQLMACIVKHLLISGAQRAGRGFTKRCKVGEGAKSAPQQCVYWNTFTFIQNASTLISNEGQSVNNRSSSNCPFPCISFYHNFSSSICKKVCNLGNISALKGAKTAAGRSAASLRLLNESYVNFINLNNFTDLYILQSQSFYLSL